MQSDRSLHVMPPGFAPGEARAPIEELSPIKRGALIACVNGDGTLHKSRGVWKSPCADSNDRPIFGVTVADLSREGMLQISGSGRSAVARITERGSWFARTAATEIAVTPLSTITQSD